MSDNKEKVFDNNPYWENDNQKVPQQVDDTSVDKETDNEDENNDIKKTIPVEQEKTTDESSSLDEPFPKVNVCKEDNAITFVVGDQTFKMVKVEGGTFTMGDTEETAKNNKITFGDEKPAHQVQVDSFYICDSTVTQELWKAVFPTADIIFKKGKDNLPKVKISWDDCRLFIKRLNKITGFVFRMPTEAEWEFAARGGTHSKNYKFAGTNSVSFVAWYNTSEKPIQPVKKLKTNELGLYDMSGNVYEWCSDWYAKDYYANSPQNNPKGPEDGQYKVIRGGSVFSTAESCRNTMRMNLDPKLREAGVGLRLVLQFP